MKIKASTAIEWICYLIIAAIIVVALIHDFKDDFFFIGIQ